MRCCEELQKVSPVAVTEAVANAALRQGNAYFSSSDAAFDDRYEAWAEWERVKAGAIPVEGGWRIYSGGPGLFVDLLVRQLAGRRRLRGEEVLAPVVADSESVGIELDAKACVKPGKIENQAHIHAQVVSLWSSLKQ